MMFFKNMKIGTKLMVFMVIFDYFDIASCAQFPEPIDENTQGSKFGYR